MTEKVSTPYVIRESRKHGTYASIRKDLGKGSNTRKPGKDLLVWSDLKHAHVFKTKAGAQAWILDSQLSPGIIVEHPWGSFQEIALRLASFRKS